MVKYECFRCGYNTKHRGHLLNHLNRKNVCNPTEDDVDIEEIKKYYGFEKSPKVTQNDPKMTPNETPNIDPKKPQKPPNEPICIYCNKFYSKMCHLRRHEKTCKKKKEAEALVMISQKELENMKEESENMKEEIEELKKKIIELVNKNEILEIKLNNKTDELNYNYRQCMSLNRKLRKENKI